MPADININTNDFFIPVFEPCVNCKKMCKIGENVENAVDWAILYTDKICTELRHVSSLNFVIAKGSL